MGREVKRVVAGFDWPVEKVWDGFLNPHYRACPAENVTCFGGQTAAAQWMDAICRFLAGVGVGCVEYPQRDRLRARGFNSPHPYLTKWEQAPHYEIPPDVVVEADKILDAPGEHRRLQSLLAYRLGHPPEILPLTDELLDVLAKFAGVGRSEFEVADCGPSWPIQAAIFRAAGVEREGWGRCPVCRGDNLHPDARNAYEAWEVTPVPSGDWWQVWETVSEGSPVTPAFATAAGLVDHLVAVGDAWDQGRGRPGWERAAAESFVRVGFAPALTMIGGESFAPRDGGMNPPRADVPAGG